MTSPLLALLQNEMRLDERSIVKLIATAPMRYKTFKIKKKNGKSREISQPSSELKIAQNVIIRHYLSSLPVHPSATAYKPGGSIVLNATPHAEINGPIRKFDFADFFPSITEQSWLSYCKRHNVMDREDAIRAGRLMFRRPPGGRILRLSIGAPTSPILSNILLFDFDTEITRRIEGHGIRYTRYADDLTFSAERTGNLLMVEKVVRSVLSSMTSPKLKINENKSLLVTKKYRRNITGINITNDGNVSIGRVNKRQIRAALHKFSLDGLSERDAAILAGKLSFAHQVEPEFVAKMSQRYGEDVIVALKAQGRAYRRPRVWKVRRSRP